MQLMVALVRTPPSGAGIPYENQCKGWMELVLQSVRIVLPSLEPVF